MSFLPMTPVQAMVLRRQANPVATVNAAGAGTLPPASTGQSPVPVATPASAGLGFTPNTMDELLLARANRPGQIGSGLELAGRLAAMGVGRKISRENEQGQRDAINAVIGDLPENMRAAARIAALSGDPSAILPLLQQQAAITAKQNEPAKKGKRLLTAEEKANAGFQPGDVVEINQDTNDIEVVKSSDLVTPERLAQQQSIAAAGRSSVEVNNLTGPAGAVAAAKQAQESGILSSEEAAKIIKNVTATDEDKAGLSDREKQARIRTEMEPIRKAAVEQLESAASKLADNPLDQEAIGQYQSAMVNYATAKSKIQLPSEAVTNDQIKAVTDLFPAPGAIAAAKRFGQDPVKAILDAELGRDQGQTPKEVDQIMKNMPPGSEFLGFE